MHLNLAIALFSAYLIFAVGTHFGAHKNVCWFLIHCTKIKLIPNSVFRHIMVVHIYLNDSLLRTFKWIARLLKLTWKKTQKSCLACHNYNGQWLIIDAAQLMLHKDCPSYLTASVVYELSSYYVWSSLHSGSMYNSGSSTSLPVPCCILLDVMWGSDALPHAGCGVFKSLKEVVVLPDPWLGYVGVTDELINAH